MPLDVSTSVLAIYGSHLGIWLVDKIGSFESEDPSKASLCYGDFGAVMSTAAGRVDQDLVRAPVEENGLVDSIRLVLAGNCQASRRLLRLLTS